MKLPKQSLTEKNTNIDGTTTPYNFVPLPDKVKFFPKTIDQDMFVGYTGCIKCKLTTISPLYTQCGMTPKLFKTISEKKNNGKDYILTETEKTDMAKFFFIDDEKKPVIPGSSLRGMLRSLVEIIGYCKMDDKKVSDKKLIYREIGDKSNIGKSYRKVMNDNANVRGGYLFKKDRSWFIRPASKVNGTSVIRIKKDLFGMRDKGHELHLWVKPPTKGDKIADRDYIKWRNEPGYKKAVAISSRGFNVKNYYAIYEEDVSADVIKIPEDIWNLYVDDRDMKKGIGARELGKDDNETYPIFYLVDDDENLLFIGPTRMFRIPYKNSILDYIPDEIKGPEGLDMSDRIFGVASNNEEEGKCHSFSGRVSFTDAKYESAKDKLWFKEKPFYLPILSNPKPTTFQHYLVQDADRGHSPKSINKMAHYSTLTSETVLRGTKMYWHKNNFNENEIISDESDVNEKHQKKVKALASGVTFSFTINFENLKDYELGALLWALVLPGEKGKEYHHKLGMGKPYGMGAVKITPKLYLSDRKKRYSCLFGPEGSFSLMDEKANPNEFIDVFEDYMADFLELAYFRDATRIKTLLKMAESSGQKTRYMTIKPNEFKNRSVLPDPLDLNTK